MEQSITGCPGGAEAVLNLQADASISVAYHPHYGPHDDLILLELDEKLLPDVMDQRVTMRGQPDEDAVLCTQSKTYSIKYVGTSNSVFLIPPSNDSFINGNLMECEHKDNEKPVVAPVIKVSPGILELAEVAPKLDKLKRLLLENPYKVEDEMEIDYLDGWNQKQAKLYKWDDLIDEVQASDDELRSGLLALSAAEIDGYWRIVDEKYMDVVLKMLLHNAVLNDWSLYALNEGEVVSVLESDGFPPVIAQHCLCVYGCKLDDAVGNVWKLDDRRVCVHFAKEILREGKMKMDSFMGEWIRKIPEGMQATLDMLEGEVLTERIGVEAWVYAFSASSLPSNPAERFSILFKERPKWEEKDLQPYLRDLIIPGLSSEALLLKYTRRIQPNPGAEPVFTAR